MVRTHGARRRAEILEAALVVIAQRGAEGMRIQDVARVAKVSTGTVHYHFGDIEDLFAAIHEAFVDRFVRERSERVAAIPDARAKMRALVSSGIPTGFDDGIVVAMYGLYGRIRTQTVHRVLAQRLWDEQVGIYGRALEVGMAQGHFTIAAPIPVVANNAVALEDAYGMHVTLGNASVSADQARSLIMDYLCRSTECPDLFAE